MVYGFKDRAEVDLPDWSLNLRGYYWKIRVEGRNKSMRRKYYRYVRAEKLRLVEAGICLRQINAVCKYLVSLKQVNADRLKLVFESDSKQLCFDF